MMKRTLLLGLLLTSVSAFAFMGGPRDDMRMLFETLELSKAQKSQLRIIRNEAQDERRELMDKLEDLRDKTDERVKAVLTDQQKKIYEAKRAEMKEKFRHGAMSRDRMSPEKSPCAPKKNPKCDQGGACDTMAKNKPKFD